MGWRFHLTPVRMAKIKNSGDSRCWQGCGERGTLLHFWWDCKLVQPLWKAVWQLFLKKLDIVLPEDPAIPLLGIYPENVPTGKKNTCSTMFIAALFIIEAGNNPDVPQQRSGYRKYGTFTQGNTTYLLKMTTSQVLQANGWNRKISS